MASGFSAKEGRPERVLNSKLIIGIEYGAFSSDLV
jgi:hypothetical protein